MIQLQVMDTLKLISSVQSRKPLWDRAEKTYHNRDVTKDLWHEVCLEVGLDSSAIDTVKKRWNSLRDVFRREYNKATRSETNNSVWFYYDNMSFLIPQMRPPRPITVELVESQDFEQYQYEDSLTETYEESQNVIVHPPLKRRLSDDLVDCYDNRQRTKSTRKEAADADDSDYHFLMSMLPFLKALPQRKKMAARIKILQVIMGEEESTSSGESRTNSQITTMTKINKKESTSTAQTSDLSPSTTEET